MPAGHKHKFNADVKSENACYIQANERNYTQRKRYSLIDLSLRDVQVLRSIIRQNMTACISAGSQMSSVAEELLIDEEDILKGKKCLLMNTKKLKIAETETRTVKERDFARLVGLSLANLQRRRQQGEIEHLRIGRRIIYLIPEHFDAFIKAHEVSVRGE